MCRTHALIALQRRRVAELLSQLPLELDVEKLVAKALGASLHGAAPASGAVSTAASAPNPGPAGGAGGVPDANGRLQTTGNSGECSLRLLDWSCAHGWDVR